MVAKLKRYLTLWLSFAKISLQLETEYRSHFFLHTAERIGFALITIFTIEILFAHTDSISGWNKGEVFLIYAFFRFISAFSGMFARKNLTQFSYLVNSGNFDLLLTKPINTLFYTSFRIVSFDRFSQVIIAIFLVLYANTLTPIQWTAFTITLAIIVLLLGSIIRYCIGMIIQIPIFWLQKIENLERLEFSFFGIARFPRQAFPPLMAKIFTFIIPVMMVAAIPAEIVLGKSPFYLLFILILFTIFLLWFTNFFFSFALRHYSSASS